MPTVMFFSSLSDLVACLASLSIQVLNELALESHGGVGVSELVRHAATLTLLANCGYCLWQVLNYSPAVPSKESAETKPIASRKSKKDRRRRIIEDSDEEENM